MDCAVVLCLFCFIVQLNASISYTEDRYFESLETCSVVTVHVAVL